jgi:tartronate-semialdehyde synthase
VHAAVDIATICKPVAKATWCITNPADTSKIMREAFRTASSGRPGPVLIDLPIDVQMTDMNYDPAHDKPLPWTLPVPDPAAISEAMDLIQKSEAPMIIARYSFIPTTRNKIADSLLDAPGLTRPAP